MKELPFKVKEVGPSEIRFFAMKASILCPFVDLNFHNFSQNHGSRCTIFPCLMGRNCYIGEIQPYILLQDNHSILITKTKPIKDELPVLLRCHITLSKAKSITLNSTLKKSHVSAFQWADWHTNMLFLLVMTFRMIELGVCVCLFDILTILWMIAMSLCAYEYILCFFA